MSASGISAPGLDHTGKDYESLRSAMLDLARDRLPEWTDHSPNDLGVVLVELFAHMGDLILYYQDRVASESFLETASERASVMHLLRLIGYELKPPQAASVEVSLLFARDATATVTIPTGAEFKTALKDRSEPVHFQYLGEPLTLVLADVPPSKVPGNDTKLYRQPARKLPLVQVDRRVAQEVVGSSDGTPAQRFALRQSPLIASTLELSVREGATFQVWTRVDSLFLSGPNDLHYSVTYDHRNVAWVELGDGTNGKVPRRGHDNIVADYRVGGGSKGNVGVGAISKVVTTGISGLSAAYNAVAASGGTEAEPIEDAKRRAPKLYRTMGRAVTASDYEAHARAFGISKARARESGWNTIALFVAPAGGGQPSDLLRRNLERYFEDKRIMTSIVRVHAPTYVPVFIALTLSVSAQFFAEDVHDRARGAVEALLAFDAVDFAFTLYVSKVFEALEALDGVDAVNVTRFARDPSATGLPATGKLELGWEEIPVLGQLGITLEGGRTRA